MYSDHYQNHKSRFLGVYGYQWFFLKSKSHDLDAFSGYL